MEKDSPYNFEHQKKKLDTIFDSIHAKTKKLRFDENTEINNWLIRVKDFAARTVPEDLCTDRAVVFVEKLKTLINSSFTCLAEDAERIKK